MTNEPSTTESNKIKHHVYKKANIYGQYPRLQKIQIAAIPKYPIKNPAFLVRHENWKMLFLDNAIASNAQVESRIDPLAFLFVKS